MLTFKLQPQKIVKRTQTIRVFDHFVGVTLKGYASVFVLAENLISFKSKAQPLLFLVILCLGKKNKVCGFLDSRGSLNKSSC